MFRFTIRELVLSIALVAIAAAWLFDRLTLNDALAKAKAKPEPAAAPASP